MMMTMTRLAEKLPFPRLPAGSKATVSAATPSDKPAARSGKILPPGFLLDSSPTATPWIEIFEKPLKVSHSERFPSTSFGVAFARLQRPCFQLTLHGAPTCCLLWRRREKFIFNKLDYQTLTIRARQAPVRHCTEIRLCSLCTRAHFVNWSMFSYGYRNPQTFRPISCDRAHVELSNLKCMLHTLFGFQKTENVDGQDFDRTFPLMPRKG
ncbi:hypothetical protein Y032_0204g1888 [Ancylostoma ceylanicum]|uniref:Uncharacterized protein n=1 Tax=Ancylostoma ceylanicum TaxID=53326 RepID=A0A016SMN6_9BILA|nr:hypothetical protein Y032_0204g1888 [Ancylostoma ceylanicum]